MPTTRAGSPAKVTNRLGRPADVPRRRIKPATLRAVRPNAGITAAYRKRLIEEIDAMAKVVLRTLRLVWRDDPPALAEDSAATAAQAALAELRRRWETRFAELGPVWGRRFTRDAFGSAERGLRAALKAAGLTVAFQATATQRDAFAATLNEQVNLIRSIPSECLTDVASLVAVSVQTGGDLGPLAKALRERFGLTRKRAALIARDQNNKATATITMVRQLDLGIKKAQWLHSAGGKHPRPSHVKASRDHVAYDVDRGWYDPDEQKWIYPGQLINCRCVSLSILPHMTAMDALPLARRGRRMNASAMGARSPLAARAVAGGGT